MGEKKKEVKITDRVSIDNLVNWDLYFIGIESPRDITIPASVKNYKQLTVAEVDSQIKAGNGFFSGIDSQGNNAYIKINDVNVRNYIFGTEVEGEDATPQLLTLDAVKELLAVTPRANFEEELKKLVVTEAEKKMIVPLAKEAGIDEVEQYKAVTIEKYTGLAF